MLAAALKKYNVDAEDILKSAENQKLLETLSHFAELLTHYGYNIESYSQSSLKKLSEVPNDKKELITAYFKNWLNWIDPEQSPGPADDSKNAVCKKLWITII